MDILRKQLGQIPATSLSEISEIRIHAFGAVANIAGMNLSPELEKRWRMGNKYTAQSLVILPGEQHRPQPNRGLFAFQRRRFQR